MSLTPDGAGMLAEWVAEHLQGGQLEVTDGNGNAARAVLTAEVRDALVACSAIFGEQEADFEWRVRRVLDSAGRVLDEEPEDMGRKPPGAVWTLEVDIEPGPKE